MNTPLSSMSTSEKLNLITIGLLPILALMGNAIADIGLVLVVLVFLGTSGSAIKRYPKSWLLRLSFIFWIWILICSSASPFPAHSFQDSLPWIRFPLYAFALSLILLQGDGRHFKVFIAACVIGTMIEFSFLISEYYIFHHGGMRLFGTFQKLMPGWYMMTFGLIAILYFFKFTKIQNINWYDLFGMAFFFVATSYGLLITGELMSTGLFLTAIILYFLVIKNLELKRIAGIMAGLTTFLTLFAVVVLNENDIRERVYDALMTRLPWLSTSDYGQPLRAGYNIALLHPLFGVGPKNTFAYCTMLNDQGLMVNLLHVTACPWHPHNLYLQIAAESGVIGLLLFSALALYLVGQSVIHFVRNKAGNNLAIILIPLAFFPLQSYSQAFGQSRNFYFWTIVGFALFVIRSHLRERGGDERL